MGPITLFRRIAVPIADTVISAPPSKDRAVIVVTMDLRPQAVVANAIVKVVAPNRPCGTHKVTRKSEFAFLHRQPLRSALLCGAISQSLHRRGAKSAEKYKTRSCFSSSPKRRTVIRETFWRTGSADADPVRFSHSGPRQKHTAHGCGWNKPNRACLIARYFTPKPRL